MPTGMCIFSLISNICVCVWIIPGFIGTNTSVAVSVKVSVIVIDFVIVVVLAVVYVVVLIIMDYFRLNQHLPKLTRTIREWELILRCPESKVIITMVLISWLHGKVISLFTTYLTNDILVLFFTVNKTI